VLDVDGTVFQALQAVGVSPARNSMQPRGLMLYEQPTPSRSNLATTHNLLKLFRASAAAV
jgi:hypothetical protein